MKYSIVISNNINPTPRQRPCEFNKWIQAETEQNNVSSTEKFSNEKTRARCRRKVLPLGSDNGSGVFDFGFEFEFFKLHRAGAFDQFESGPKNY